MSSHRTYRVIVTGGGTGGHIYPAIAIANALKEKVDAEILFVGAEGKMEMQKVPEAGYDIIGLWISGIQRKLSLSNLLFPFKLISSIMRSSKIIKDFKPQVVVGVGGYASGPLVYAATKKKIPALLQEQNSYAGLANKWLSKKVQKICVAYSGMEKYFPKEKIVLTGNPVRQDITNLGDKKFEAASKFDLSRQKNTLLVLGGSLGARTINEAMIECLEEITEAGNQVLWQTGKFYYEEMKVRTRNMDLSNVKMLEFIKDMDLAYALAEVVVSRAGALSISELCLVGKPVIFIPSPNVAEDHQTKNAMALTKEDAALMIPDDQAVKSLGEEVLDLIRNGSKKQALSENIKKLAKPSASSDIAEEVIKLVAA